MPHPGRLPIPHQRPKPGRALANELRRVEAMLPTAPAWQRPALLGVAAALRWALTSAAKRPSELYAPRPQP